MPHCYREKVFKVRLKRSDVISSVCLSLRWPALEGIYDLVSLQEAGCLEITVVCPNSQYTWEGDIFYLAFWSRKHSVVLLIWQAVWKWKGGWILGDITLNILICMFYFMYRCPHVSTWIRYMKVPVKTRRHQVAWKESCELSLVCGGNWTWLFLKSSKFS